MKHVFSIGIRASMTVDTKAKLEEVTIGDTYDCIAPGLG